MKYLITGASSGIGKRCSQRLLEAGNTCILISRRIKSIEEYAGGMKNAVPIYCDLADLRSIEGMISKLNDDGMFPVDGIVHCAGIAPLKRVEENDIETVMQTYQVNLFSFIELMRLLVKTDGLNEGSSVICMSSVVAERGSNRQTIYSGTKAALNATARCLSLELLSKKIRVNTVEAATVETEMLEKLREESDNLDEKIKAHSPLGVIPADRVCDMIEFLLSDCSSYITGAALPVDAGYFL